MLEHLLFALRRVDGQAEHALHLADLDGVFGALVEQADDDFIDAVDGVAEAVEIVFGFGSVVITKNLFAVTEKRF